MSGHRHRVLWRNAIYILIACALVFVSSAQPFVVAKSLADPAPSHIHHLQTADMTGVTDQGHHAGHGANQAADPVNKHSHDDMQKAQEGPCCELSCVTFAVIATASFEIASPYGQHHLAAVFDDRTGYEVFDLMRPPRV